MSLLRHQYLGNRNGMENPTDVSYLLCDGIHEEQLLTDKNPSGAFYRERGFSPY